MNRPNLYFRLSLIWLVIWPVAPHFCGSRKGASISHYGGLTLSVQRGSLILNVAPP